VCVGGGGGGGGAVGVIYETNFSHLILRLFTPRLPQDQEIEFSIDSLLETTPISKATYRMVQ
jgi:hypothetical protein